MKEIETSEIGVLADKGNHGMDTVKAITIEMLLRDSRKGTYRSVGSVTEGSEMF